MLGTLTRDEIRTFFSDKNFDIRINKNGRWIDQKCTPDVVSVVSDCIVNYIMITQKDAMTAQDIWFSAYTKTYVREIFAKPDTDAEEATAEYNKFFMQPMEMLAASGVMDKQKVGVSNVYTVKNPTILSKLSMSERNALTFLQEYINKVLVDSGLINVFDVFFDSQTPETYHQLKTAFSRFTIANTKINGEVECNRIFTKVINPLAFAKHVKGTEHGYISKNPVTYDMLMYNRDNFRDIYVSKPKDVTRRVYAAQNSFRPNNAYFIYLMQKAKRKLHNYNDRFREGKTEVLVGKGQDGPAIHMHHIFPSSRYPQISHYVENLIALTPTQHMAFAHPNGETQLIDVTYQKICLLAKTASIKENLTLGEDYQIYEFGQFLFVLDTGYNTKEFKDIEENDFNGIVTKINLLHDSVA